MKRLHSNDYVAIVSIAYDIVTGGIALVFGFTWLALAIIAGGIGTIAAFNYWEDRFFRRGTKISWLDYMRVRDLLASGHNWEAIMFVLMKGYKMTEEEILQLQPDEVKSLIQKLKTEQTGEEFGNKLL